MTMKKNRRRTELREWVDEQYRKTPSLKRRVEALVEEMSIEQGLIALRDERHSGGLANVVSERNEARGRAKPVKRKLPETA